MAEKKITLNLTDDEKAALKANKLKIADLTAMDAAAIASILHTSDNRAKELHAHTQFQSIPSVGVKFAGDLISIGCYTLADLKHKTGANLIDELELHEGAWIDPCVEDQCRLVVHYANHKDTTKSWWDFTDERKATAPNMVIPLQDRLRRGWSWISIKKCRV